MTYNMTIRTVKEREEEDREVEERYRKWYDWLAEEARTSLPVQYDTIEHSEVLQWLLSLRGGPYGKSPYELAQAFIADKQNNEPDNPTAQPDNAAIGASGVHEYEELTTGAK